MPYYCTVPRCTSMAGKAKNVSFHQFPRDEELAKLWNNILKRGKPYTKYSKVCSLHFTPDDYTMTSGQKIKGQWRTLRKDAIPSRNLPTDTPACQSSSWTPPGDGATVIDARMHQQMAQHIYIQTMLAMQAASLSALNTDSQPLPDELTPPILDQSDTQTNTHADIDPKPHTYKCTQCSKCFKDPDVFLLHKRTHKENNNGNEMLKANPILANLLNDKQTDGQKNMNMESQILKALTINMENYLRNLSTIMTQNDNYDENNDFESKDDNYDSRNDESNEDNDSKENYESKNDNFVSEDCDTGAYDSNLVIDESS